MNDTPNGCGKSEWADGSKFVGYYKNNMKEGIGEYI
jgi:MORN repeat.